MLSPVKNFHDGYMRVGEQLGNIEKNVALTADNQIINPGQTPFIRLTSDNATSTNRSFTLFNGSIMGQIIYLTLTGSTGAAELVSGGNVTLVGGVTWTAAVDRTLVLMWDATSVKWRELSRN